VPIDSSCNPKKDSPWADVKSAPTGTDREANGPEGEDRTVQEPGALHEARRLLGEVLDRGRCQDEATEPPAVGGLLLPSVCSVLPSADSRLRRNALCSAHIALGLTAFRGCT
jgi:hypothetical protein